VRPEILKSLGLEKWVNGVLFIGTRGWLIANYDVHEFGPKDAFKDFVRPKQFIPESIGHHREWIEACKTRGTTTCSFGYSGPLTEAVLLGVVSYRTGKRLDWDADRLVARNAPEAERYITERARSGWNL
jgi:hypothetical protein